MSLDGSRSGRPRDLVTILILLLLAADGHNCLPAIRIAVTEAAASSCWVSLQCAPTHFVHLRSTGAASPLRHTPMLVQARVRARSTPAHAGAASRLPTQVIIRQGADADAFAFVVSGAVRLLRALPIPPDLLDERRTQVWACACAACSGRLNGASQLTAVSFQWERRTYDCFRKVFP
jgi:hypothetical protein